MEGEKERGREGGRENVLLYNMYITMYTIQNWSIQSSQIQ